MVKYFVLALLGVSCLATQNQASAAGRRGRQTYATQPQAVVAAPARVQTGANVTAAPKAAMPAAQPTQSYSYNPGYNTYYRGGNYYGGGNYYRGAGGYAWPNYPSNQYNAGIGQAYSPAAGLRPGQIFGTFGLRPADARVRGAY